MGLNDMASAERIHIGFFGIRNAGKSSLVNAVTGQNIALVSDTLGTTTDPVKKSMELLPLGPVVIIDTPGIDDEGVLGKMRVKRAKQVLNYADIVVLVIDAYKGVGKVDKELIAIFKDKKIPYILAYNKADLLKDIPETKDNIIYVSAETKHNIYELKELIGNLIKREENNKVLVSDLISKNDIVVLVTPIDSSAPKGRLILPQQQTIREVIEAGGIATICQPDNLKETLYKLNENPKIIITDSQVFEKVSNEIPEDILLTSFSILFARYKGNLLELVRGAAKLKDIKDNDTILISEGCTHHRQCGDIGTVKLPAWIKKYTGKEINFEFSSGMEFPDDLSKYALVIHCGGCMLNEREMHYRILHAKDYNVPMTNYGVAIAEMHGILRRSLEPFPEILNILAKQEVVV